MSDVLGARIVPPRDRKSIRKDTYKLREILGLKNELYFPIMQFLESCLPLLDTDFHIEVVKDNLLPGRMAETIPDQHLIRIKESVYNGACLDHPWARKVMAHELGHYLYHDSTKIAYAHPQRGEQFPKQFNPEYQAEVFASELLAPINLIKGQHPRWIAQKCGVPYGTAEGQLVQVAHTQKERKKKKAAKHKSKTARQ